MADIRRGDSLIILVDEYSITTTRLWAARLMMGLVIVVAIAGGGQELLDTIGFLEIGGALFGLFVMYASLVRFLATKDQPADEDVSADG